MGVPVMVLLTFENEWTASISPHSPLFFFEESCDAEEISIPSALNGILDSYRKTSIESVSIMNQTYFIAGFQRPMAFPSVSWMIAVSPTDFISIFGMTILPPSFSTFASILSMSSTIT